MIEKGKKKKEKEKEEDRKWRKGVLFSNFLFIFMLAKYYFLCELFSVNGGFLKMDQGIEDTGDCMTLQVR